ncbi:hypothetical protein C7476_10617 [Phyllobacterium bourgognense]|uniref:Uncharacterized protein n=1 Tax=Phyllobacterium bourgognense TaxID=314236 RepID=A0A368YUN5_9HYPH|nr:hypothetical protein C7476_10617 [Phyllobacterium bourgognense]
MLSYYRMPELFQTNKMEKQKISPFNEISLLKTLQKYAVSFKACDFLYKRRYKQPLPHG